MLSETPIQDENKPTTNIVMLFEAPDLSPRYTRVFNNTEAMFKKFEIPMFTNLTNLQKTELSYNNIKSRIVQRNVVTVFDCLFEYVQNESGFYISRFLLEPYNVEMIVQSNSTGDITFPKFRVYSYYEDVKEHIAALMSNKHLNTQTLDFKNSELWNNESLREDLLFEYYLLGYNPEEKTFMTSFGPIPETYFELNPNTNYSL